MNPTNGYALKGSYVYRDESGEMTGSALRFDGGKLVGLVNDQDGNTLSGTNKYLLGMFNEEGLVLLKIPPLDRRMHLVAWALRGSGPQYTGGWVPLDMTLGSLALSAKSTLQAVAMMNPSKYGIFSHDTWETILSESRRLGQEVSLTLTEGNLSAIKRELSL